MAKAKEVLRGITAQGRSKTYHRRGLWAIKKKNGGKFPVTEKKVREAKPEGKVRVGICYLDTQVSEVICEGGLFLWAAPFSDTGSEVSYELSTSKIFIPDVPGASSSSLGITLSWCFITY